MPQRSSDDTLVTGGRTSASDDARIAAAALQSLPHSDRYNIASTLASGGMGEVLVAHDVPLQRDVVVKRMRTATPSSESVTRFLREARIQGRLEHPAIVPVHELALDPHGRPFFAMKHITGTTLADVLARNRSGVMTGWSRAQLLRAFVDVCLAIELAHTRGVLHRDLKPGNIALGDFGEVYVLDWGVARIIGEDHPDTLEPLPPTPQPTRPSEAAVSHSVLPEDWPLAPDADASATRPGAILGTPGYMAPEQMRGDPTIGPAADIYSLGCILFEILAGEPLHARSGPMASTALGADARPSQRAPATDISPELDAICVRATATNAKDRYPSARMLAAEVQRYLDGDRDVARRRALASHHLERARDAFARSDDLDARREAVRSAGRALALDPESAEAAELVSHLVLTPQAKAPAQLQIELETELDREVRHHSRVASLGFAVFLLYLPVLVWIGIRDWKFFAIGYALVGLSLAYSLWSSSMKRVPKYRAWVTMLLSAILVAYFGRLFGPFLLPAGIVPIAMAISANHPHLMTRPLVLYVTYVVAALGPWGLELVGALEPTYRVTSEGYLLMSSVLELTPVAGQIAIAGFIASVIVVIGYLSMRLARLNQRSRLQVEIQAWHLRQLVPVLRRTTTQQG